MQIWVSFIDFVLLFGSIRFVSRFLLLFSALFAREVERVAVRLLITIALNEGADVVNVRRFFFGTCIHLPF